MVKAAGNSNSPYLRSSSEARREGPTGVARAGRAHRRLPRNLGDPVASEARAIGITEQGTTVARREGRPEVGAARSTDEAGEATRATLWREGAAEPWNREKER
jgi:hypothetical protein